MSDSSPSVSVVIPALHATNLLGDALESIQNQDYPNIVEVIVASGDAATSTLAASLGATVVANPTARTPTGLNLAIAVATGEVIVRCDAQSKLPVSYVSRAVETLERTGAVTVGGMQIPRGRSYWEKAIAAAMSSPLGAGRARYRIGGVEGAAETVYLGVFDKDRVLELGGFDEQFARNQDYELNHRIVRSGGVVWFDPELMVEYRPRGSLRALWSQYFQYGSAKRTFARVHPGSLRPRQLASPLLVLGLATSLLIAPWWLPAFVFPVSYFASVVIGSITTNRSGHAPGMAAALATMHISWGLGFWTGR